jgi:hypothetical protein
MTLPVRMVKEHIADAEMFDGVVLFVVSARSRSWRLDALSMTNVPCSIIALASFEDSEQSIKLTDHCCCCNDESESSGQGYRGLMDGAPERPSFVQFRGSGLARANAS